MGRPAGTTTRGRSDHAHALKLDLPDDEFNYDEFVEREFGNKPQRRPNHWFWWGTALVVLLLSLWFLLHR